MAFISHKVLLVLFSLSLVMATTISNRKGKFKKMPLEELFIEMSQMDNDDEIELKMVEDLIGDDPDIGDAVVEGLGGCKKMLGEHTTASGAGHLSVFACLIFFLICSLFYFILNC